MSVKIVKKLSAWYLQNARDLPWRTNRDPYWVWLSEIMAQQTQIASMLPYFERFLQAFPKVEDLAHAPENEVMKLWAGLGYYSRARNLHRGAKMIAEHGFPQNAEEWKTIPGVGDYTAGSIASIVFNERAPVVDGNVVRVLSRVNAITKISSDRNEIWTLSKKLVNVKETEPRVFNQALMELGALVCRPKNPNCGDCPISSECSGKKNPLKYPTPKAKKEFKRVNEDKWIILRKSKSETLVLLSQGDEHRWRKGLYDFPNSGEVKLKSVAKFAQEFSDSHVVTNHKIKRNHRVFWVKDQKLKGEWFKLKELPGVPAPVKRALKKIALPVN